MNRTIGIIGGMGPEATADLFREIIRSTPARVDQDHIPILIYSNPKIPERTRAILEGGESPLPLIIETARVLERAGAGLLVMPCNTAHYYFDQLQAAVGTPILNMIEETLSSYRKLFPEGRAVGLLATPGTVQSGIYQSTFTRRGIEVLAPDDEGQKQVFSGIQQVKAGRQDLQTELSMESVGSSLVGRGAKAVILGCTEIPLAFKEDRVDYPVLNATRILAQAAAQWGLGQRS